MLLDYYRNYQSYFHIKQPCSLLNISTKNEPPFRLPASPYIFPSEDNNVAGRGGRERGRGMAIYQGWISSGINYPVKREPPFYGGARVASVLQFFFFLPSPPSFVCIAHSMFFFFLVGEIYSIRRFKLILILYHRGWYEIVAVFLSSVKARRGDERWEIDRERKGIVYGG